MLLKLQLYMSDRIDLRSTWVLYIDPEGPLHHVSSRAAAVAAQMMNISGD